MKFDIIYSDPPWKQNARNNPKSRFGKGVPYPTMKTEAICAIPVQDICNDNCVLFLWVTGPKLKDGIRVIEAWGFRYVTIGFSWVKVYKNKIKKPVHGIGYYTKHNVELCLLGIRGKMVPISDHVSQVIIEPISVHSRKPKCARERIVQLFGGRPRIELFARQTAFGWYPVGNEITGEDITVAITRLSKPLVIK